MRICKKCGTSFKTQAKIDGKFKNLGNRKYCLECSPFGEHNTRQIHVDPSLRAKYDDVHVRQTNLRRDRRIKLLEMAGSKCLRCGYDKSLNALDFHHTNPAEKLFSLSQNNLTLFSWEKILEEFKKVVCVCRNCHVELHDEMKNNMGRLVLAVSS